MDQLGRILPSAETSKAISRGKTRKLKEANMYYGEGPRDSTSQKALFQFRIRLNKSLCFFKKKLFSSPIFAMWISSCAYSKICVSYTFLDLITCSSTISRTMQNKIEKQFHGNSFFIKKLDWSQKEHAHMSILKRPNVLNLESQHGHSPSLFLFWKRSLLIFLILKAWGQQVCNNAAYFSPLGVSVG